MTVLRRTHGADGDTSDWLFCLGCFWRLQQDCLEAARIAEDMARRAAQEAVRQLEEEHPTKIVMETLPESSEP